MKTNLGHKNLDAKSNYGSEIIINLESKIEPSSSFWSISTMFAFSFSTEFMFESRNLYSVFIISHIKI